MELTTHAPRPALPPIHSFDMDKYRREEVDYQHRHGEVTSANTTASVPAPVAYPSGPPPPYTAASHSASYTSMATSLPPPAESRTIASDDKEFGASKQSKQSLPSLSEALGVESSVSYPPESVYGAPVHTSHPNSATTPPQMSRPSHAMDPPRAPPSHYSPYVHSTRRHSPPRSQDHTERRRSEFSDSGSYPGHFRPRSPPTSAPQRHEGHAYAPAETRVYERSSPPPASTQGVPYGYAKHPSYYPPSTTSTPSSASIYQPSVSQPPPGQQPVWRSERSEAHEHPGASPYGESVKRHLDLYDFELALSEIADHSTIMLDFSRQYGARLHQTQRSGPVPGTLPAITEVDELINKSRHNLEALTRMREVLVAQQVVYYQQVQEQRFKSEESRRNDSVLQLDESKGSGGFAGPEPKKRRGRAAAPGRCHSCNRAETPEWRRGPDGARTLCNACGLHYAKLTRKAGANKAAIGSSNLRPKSQDRDSDEER